MLSKLDTQFEKAFNQLSDFNKALPPDVMLKLYAFYKQATTGDSIQFNEESDMKNAFKFNAWTQLNGMTKNKAKKEYIALANSILETKLKSKL